MVLGRDARGTREPMGAASCQDTWVQSHVSSAPTRYIAPPLSHLHSPILMPISKRGPFPRTPDRHPLENGHDK